MPSAHACSASHPHGEQGNQIHPRQAVQQPVGREGQGALVRVPAQVGVEGVRGQHEQDEPGQDADPPLVVHVLPAFADLLDLRSNLGARACAPALAQGAQLFGRLAHAQLEPLDLAFEPVGRRHARVRSRSVSNT